MPELPEVETTVRGLRPLIQDALIKQVILRRPNLRFPFPTDFAKSLRGRTFRRVERRAKYLLFRTDDPQTNMLAHLGMTGNFRFCSQSEADAQQKHDHLLFHLEGPNVPSPFLAYSDPRRFGYVDLFATDESCKHIKDLGPEPLGNHFSPQSLADRIAGKKAPIKSLLLDQSIVAGLGNIYVCEALYGANISPQAKGQDLVAKSGKPKAKLNLLVPQIRITLEAAIDSGGSTLQDYKKVDGQQGYFQHHFEVYGREGEPCQRENCGATIERITQSGRSTFFCASCQKHSAR